MLEINRGNLSQVLIPLMTNMLLSTEEKELEYIDFRVKDIDYRLIFYKRDLQVHYGNVILYDLTKGIPINIINIERYRDWYSDGGYMAFFTKNVYIVYDMIIRYATNNYLGKCKSIINSLDKDYFLLSNKSTASDYPSLIVNIPKG